MILIAHRSHMTEQESQPRFWIDATEEAALTVHVYEQYDSEQQADGKSRRVDAAPELTTCYNSHE